MARTTLDLDPTVLRMLKERQQQERTSLGELASRLLAAALAPDRAPTALPPLRWTARDLGLRVDLDDKEAVRRLLDEADEPADDA